MTGKSKLPRRERERQGREQALLGQLDELDRQMYQDAGLGVHINPLDHDPRNQPWYRALSRLDYGGDKTALLKLLRSDAPLTPEVRRHLADLLDRQADLLADLLARHGRPNHRPRLPSYDATRSTAGRLELAADHVREELRNGATKKDALQRAADAYWLSQPAIEAALAGERSDVRRRAKK